MKVRSIFPQSTTLVPFCLGSIFLYVLCIHIAQNELIENIAVAKFN